MKILILIAVIIALASFAKAEDSLQKSETKWMVEEWGDLESSPTLDSIGRTETMNFWRNFGKTLDKSR